MWKIAEIRLKQLEKSFEVSKNSHPVLRRFSTDLDTEKILSCRNLGIFATNAGDRTTGTIGSFLTLVTEHFIFHESGLLYINKFL